MQVMDDIMPNPYDNLPKESYMQAHMNAIPSSQPKVALASKMSNPIGGRLASAPRDLVVVSFKYTSVSLRWSAAANAVGYNIYVNERLSLSLVGSITHVTIVSVTLGTGHRFCYKTCTLSSYALDSSRHYLNSEPFEHLLTLI